MATNVSIRLGVTGQAEVKTALDQTGQAGKDAFDKIKSGMASAGTEADRLNQKLKDAADQAKRLPPNGGPANPNYPANAPVGASSAELRSLEARAAQVRAMIDPVGAAAAIASKSVAGFDVLLAKGKISQAEHAAAVALTAAKYEEFAKRAEHAGGSLGLNSNQVAESIHVLRALGDEAFSSGLSLRGLMAEGGRIGQIFTEGNGGVSGTFKAFGSILKGVLSPLNLLIGATVALGVAGAAAGIAYEGGQERLARSLDGIGRRSGATLASLGQAASAGSLAAGISQGEGINLAAGFTAAGIGVSTTQALIGSSRRYGSVTGLGTSVGGEELAKLFADPAKGLDELDKRLGFVDDALSQTVKNLTAQGDVEGARNVLTEAYLKALNQTTDTTWSFTHALESAGRGLGDFFHNAGKNVAGVFGYQSDADRLATLQNTQANLRKTDEGGNHADEIQGLQALIAPLVKSIAAAAEQAAKNTQQSRADETSKSAGDLVRRIMPDVVRETTSANSLALLGRALASPDVMRSLNGAGISNGQVGQAFDRTAVMAANANPIANMVTDYRLARQEIEAFTLAEHIAVDARRAEIAVIREGGDVQKAALAAEIARNTLIDKANNAASDRYDLAVQNRALVGMAPLERRIQEFKNTFEGVGGYLSKDDATRKEITDAMQPVQADLLRAGDEITAAMRSVAEKIRGVSGDGLAAAGGAKLGSFDTTQGTATPAMIEAAARATGLPASLIAALGQKENSGRLSGGTSLLGSDGRPSSAYGFGQLTDAAAKDVAGIHPGFNKMDPTTAVMGAAEYLKLEIQRAGGSYAGGLNKYSGNQAGYAADVLHRANMPLTIGGKASLGMSELTAGGKDRGAEAVGVSGIREEAQIGPLTSANTALQNQIALLNVQKSTLGQSTSAVQAAAEAQKLLNTYQNEDPAHKVLNWKQITAGVDTYRTNLQAALKAEEDFKNQQQQLIGALDGVRGAAREGLGTFVSDLEHGRSVGKALQDVMSGLTSKLINLAEDQAINSIFGKSGSSSTGVPGIGGFIASLFGGGGGGMAGLGGAGGGIGANAGGTDDWKGGASMVGENGPEVVNLPKGSQVIPNNVLGRSTDASPSVVVHNYSGTATADAKVSQGPSGQKQIEVMVDDAMLRNMNSNSRATRAFQQRAGVGRTG